MNNDDFSWLKVARLYVACVGLVVGAFAATTVLGGLVVLSYSLWRGR